MLNFIKWIGTVAGIIGAVLVAGNNGFQVVGYIAFLIGSMAWLLASVTLKDVAGCVQWGFFTAVNAAGIANYMG